MTALSTKQWSYVEIRNEVQRLAIPLYKAQLGPFRDRPLPGGTRTADGTYDTVGLLSTLAHGTGDGYAIEIWWQREKYIKTLCLLGKPGRQLWRQAIQNVADRRREKEAEEAARGEFDGEEWS